MVTKILDLGLFTKSILIKKVYYEEKKEKNLCSHSAPEHKCRGTVKN